MLKIYNLAVRKLKDGSYTGTFTIPTGVKRSEIVQFEDSESCELYETGRIISLDEQASEKFYSLMTDLRGIVEKHEGKEEVGSLL